MCNRRVQRGEDPNTCENLKLSDVWHHRQRKALAQQMVEECDNHGDCACAVCVWSRPTRLPGVSERGGESSASFGSKRHDVCQGPGGLLWWGGGVRSAFYTRRTSSARSPSKLCGCDSAYGLSKLWRAHASAATRRRGIETCVLSSTQCHFFPTWTRRARERQPG